MRKLVGECVDLFLLISLTVERERERYHVSGATIHSSIFKYRIFYVGACNIDEKHALFQPHPRAFFRVRAIPATHPPPRKFPFVKMNNYYAYLK